MRVLQPSASQVDRILQCGWSFQREVPLEEEGPTPNDGTEDELDAAAFGTAVHAKFAAYNSVGCAPTNPSGEVEMRAADAARVGFEYIRRRFPESYTTYIEKSFAYNTKTRVARSAKLDTKTHHYDLRRNEIGGTVDLAIVADDLIVVLDLKTGREVGAPRESGQLLALALMVDAWCRKRGRAPSRIVIGFLHAPADTPPQIYDDEISIADLGTFRKRLREAYLTIGTGMLRPGEACRYCPARLICPTTSTALVQLRAPQGQLMTPQRVGEIHAALQTYDQLAKALRPQLRAYVEANGPATRPDGKVLDLVERPFTNFSQATIRRALGEVEAAKEIARLDKLGCVERGVRKELRAENERGA